MSEEILPAGTKWVRCPKCRETDPRHDDRFRIAENGGARCIRCGHEWMAFHPIIDKALADFASEIPNPDATSRFFCPNCGPGTQLLRPSALIGVHFCSKCMTEWSESYLQKDHRMPAQEVTATGAVRSTAYPKGAKFPARYDLMMRNAAGMRRLAETWGEGFAKYGADNWLKGFSESQLISHMIEHLRLHLAGDTTEDHMAHLAWNALALAWVQENKPELLDLTKPEQRL